MAKATAIFLFVFSLVSFQLVLLLVENQIFNLVVPSHLREASYFSDVIQANRVFVLFLPPQFDSFIFNYGLGILAVLVIFTAILLERSYRRLGILYAILYLLGCFIAVIFPTVILDLNSANAYLYPAEIFGIQLVMCGLVLAASIWLGFRLLVRKITV